MTRPRTSILVGALCGALVLSTPVWGGFFGLFGTEDVTLVQILAQTTKTNATLAVISDFVGDAAKAGQELLSTYHRVNAGIDALRNYSFGAFLWDAKMDLYNEYPGFREVEYASRNFAAWQGTWSSSPFTAYEAISALAADVTSPLRSDIEKGRVNIDRELVLSTEAAGGFALAHNSEQASRMFDRQMQELAALARTASPGQAQIGALRAQVILMAQQSQMMRLLSRAVRLQSTAVSFDYGDRIDSRAAVYRQREVTTDLARMAYRPVELMRFEDLP